MNAFPATNQHLVNHQIFSKKERREGGVFQMVSWPWGSSHGGSRWGGTRATLRPDGARTMEGLISLGSTYILLTS